MIEPLCRSGAHCAGKTSEGPAATDDPLCAACVLDVERRIQELPHLADALKTFLGGSMKMAHESKVRATHLPAPPMNVMVVDLLEEIREVMDRAGPKPVGELILLPPEVFGVWVKDVYQKKYLDGVDRALAIRRVHSRVSSVVGLERVWSRRVAPCPDCGEFTLGSWVGEDTIECTDEECRLVMSRDVYEQYCIEKANE